MGLIDETQAEEARFLMNADITPDVEATTLTLRDGTVRVVNMYIDRHSSAKGDGMEGETTPKLLVSFANDGTTGILVSECDGGCTFTVAVVKGDTAVEMALPTVPSYVDAGTVEFRIEM